ncbi:MAG: hypothetical protein AB8H80_02645 [Planctomycetota bacterium]
MRFVIVYQREPHARQMAFGDVVQPTHDSERAALARRTKNEFQLDVDIWLDDLSDQSRRAFGDLPNWAIVIAPGGRIVHKLPWAEPDLLERMVRRRAGSQQNKAWSKTLFDRATNANRRALAGERKDGQTQDGQKKGDQKKNDQMLAPRTKTAAARHIRSARLAWLVCHHPRDAARRSWLCELAATGTMRQRDWATQLLRPCARAAQQGATSDNATPRHRNRHGRGP